MPAKARTKITVENVEFREMELRENWNFAENSFDLVTCSPALEHIENLDFIFGQANKVLRENGFSYIGELLPFKQYQGGKTHFEIDSRTFELECFVHHISEFFAAAKKNNFVCAELRE